MFSFRSFVEELYNNTKIPFNIELEGEEELVLTSLDNVESNIIYVPINIGHKKGRIVTQKGYESCIDLLKYCIESKLKEVCVSKEELIVDILNGKNVNMESVRNNMPVLLKEFQLITIFLGTSNNECLDLIREGYSEYEIVSLQYNNYIMMIGNLEDIEDHVISLRDSISDNIYSKCYISYCKVSSLEQLKESFNINASKIQLSIKYDLPDRIYGEKGLLFETIIDSVDKPIKDKINKDFNEGFSKLDNEMVKTIEVFFEYGLNVSDASKALYVHRNTLIYRLDKIQKFTSYDIRNFNEAVIFKIAFLIWKENQKR